MDRQEIHPTLMGRRPNTRNQGARTLLVAPGLTTRNKKLLGAMGIATRNKKLLGAPGIATRSKDVTDPTSHQVHQLFLKSLVWIFVQLKKIPKGWRA